MTDQILYGPDGYQKTFTHASLAQITLQLSASTQSWVQMEDDTVALRLDNIGRILLMKLSWFPNRRAFETHMPSYDASMPFNIRWTLIGLSSYVDSSTMFADLGYANITINTLADVYQLFYENVPVKSKFTAVDDSVTNYQILRRQNITNNIAQTFFDGASRDTLIQQVKRTFVSQNFQAGISVVDGASTFPCNVLELAGIYAQDLGGQRIRIGVGAMRPVITLVGDAVISVEAGSTYTDAGATAVDADGNPLSVITTGSVDTSVLGTYILTYSAISTTGDIAETVQRSVTTIDSTAPVLTLTGGNITLTTGDTWSGEPGYDASDAYDTSITAASVTISGWDGDTATVGSFTRTYTVGPDSEGNGPVSITRQITVLPDIQNFNQTYTLAANATGFRISFDYSTITTWNYRFVVIELGTHPVLIAIWFWVTTGYTVLTLPGPDWGWSWAPGIANEVTYLPDGRFQQWYYPGANNLVNGSSVELEFLPFAPGLSYRIDGVLQTPTAQTGNPIDNLSPGLCTALVTEAQTSIKVRDSGPPRINNYLYGGAWTEHTAGKSNLKIEPIFEVSGGGSS